MSDAERRERARLRFERWRPAHRNRTATARATAVAGLGCLPLNQYYRRLRTCGSLHSAIASGPCGRCPASCAGDGDYLESWGELSWLTGRAEFRNIFAKKFL
jgi:hypothetical protein